VNSAFQLPRRLPVGTKYVVESNGQFVRRFVELPNGVKIPLRKRKALSVRQLREGNRQHRASGIHRGAAEVSAR